MSNRRSTASRTSHKQTRHEILQILAIIPLVVGGLLLLTAFTGLIVWDTAESQVVMGCLYILISFGASNAIQKKWLLALGWLLLGIALWLFESGPDIVIRILAGAIVSVSIALLAREFLRQRRQYLDSQTR
jgi:hypothetical protein